MPTNDGELKATVGRLDTALSAVADQVADLTARTGALHELVRRRLPRAARDADRKTSAAGLDIDTHQAMADKAIAEIIDAVEASESAIRRVEQILSALSVEVAEVGQAVSDQVVQSSSGTRDEVRAGIGVLSSDVEAATESMADSIAQVTQRLEDLATAVAARDDAAPVGTDHRVTSAVTETAEAVARVETLVEDLITATEERPTDVSELTSRTLERLGLSVSAKLEATAITAAEAIERAAEEAIDRAVSQFKDLAPPVVDRSTTAAVTRLEERVAALTQQRDQHDRETKTTLTGLEETVGRLASAQAEDLERILDSFETTAGLVTASSSEQGTSEDRLARVEEALAALSSLPESTEELTDSLAEQSVAFNAALEALRRRLSVRARQVATIDDASLSRLADLVADRMAAGPVPRPSTRRTASRVASAERATREEAPPAARRAARPARAAGGRRRPVD